MVLTNAQVCAGGISTEEITPDTMESRYVRHLYLAGGIAGCGRHLRRVQSAMGLGDRLCLLELLLQTIYHQIDDKL